MPIAEILTIGTEILLGEIQDTNTAFLARAIKNLGIDLYRTQTVGDNPGRISTIIKEILSRADILITTGGLGPTVDDPTRQAVADAFGLPLLFDEACWKQIQGYFSRLNRPMPENNRRQAYIPAGAIVIPNPVGTAPAFIVENGEKVLISVPGVPKEMEYLMLNSVSPYLRDRWKENQVIETRTIHTVGLGEAVLDDLVGEFEHWNNPTVGLLAKSGIVDIRVGAKAKMVEEARQMIQTTIDQMVPRLGKHVFGYDETTLASCVVDLANKVQEKIFILYKGFGQDLTNTVNLIQTQHIRFEDLASINHYNGEVSDILFDTTLKLESFPVEFICNIKTPDEKRTTVIRKYGGPPEMAPTWAINNLLDLIRLHLMDQLERKG